MEKPDTTRRRPPIVLGLALILLGIWLLGRELGLPLFRGNVLWPWFIVFVGLVFWLRYIFFPSRSSEDVFWGTAALLAGGFLLAWYNHLLSTDMHGWGDLWPLIPLIFGFSALVQWVFDVRNWGALIAGLIFGAVGAVGLAYTSGYITPVKALEIARWWPVIVILAGLGLLLKAFFGTSKED